MNLSHRTGAGHHDHVRGESSATAIKNLRSKISPPQHGLNFKPVAEWRKRAFVHDATIEPKTPRTTEFTTEEEAV